MKHLILWAGLLLSLSCSAQTIQPFDMTVFRGQISEKTLLLLLADSSRSVSATAYWDRFGRMLPADQQPILIRSARPGTSLVVRLQNTLNLPASGGWIEIRVGGQIRASGRLIVTQVRSPTTASIDAPSGVGEGTVKFWRLSNAVSGQEIRHGSSSRLVSAQFFRDDTGQLDPLIRIEIIDENRIRLIAPPGETVNGQLTTIIIQKLTQ
ncbi:hypothetical protein [Spirosoma rhododendri]|uniref:Uncharacterized protein n=1 Tax=Spirosoma rhododendri TaxID=2728024 RepID=A0A7L5DQ10_9BACT|nr:hypothetical protein [Spirosoma rhododendri]QJD79561.1 hypothetical protein HH216_14920 [Spirosoma rhododendri]